MPADASVLQDGYGPHMPAVAPSAGPLRNETAFPDETRATTTLFTEKQNRGFLELPILGGEEAAGAAFPRELDPEFLEEWARRVLDPLLP